MTLGFEDDVYIPLRDRLCRFIEETGEVPLESINEYNKLKIFSFINASEPCDICKECIIEINAWMIRHKLMNYHRAVWVIEPEMSQNLICKDIGLTVAPTTLFCDKHGNIVDMVTGRPSEKWLDKYILPLVETDESN